MLERWCVICGRCARGSCPICQPLTQVQLLDLLMLGVRYTEPAFRNCQRLNWLEEHATTCNERASQDQGAQENAEDTHEEKQEVAREAVQMWRLAVERLWLELRSDEHLPELAPLLVAAEQLQHGSWRVQRCELLEQGARPVLITAPHCMALLRDGQLPHLVEKYTAEISVGIAEVLGGSCLWWSASERRRTELLWRLNKRVNEERGEEIRDGHLLDPRNRDPNFLTTTELTTNTWFQHMVKARRQWGAASLALHVDVHGCQDPPRTPSHLTIGLGAMCLHKGESGSNAALHFGHALCRELGEVLAKARLPRAPLVLIAAPGPDKDCPRFSGAWKGDRHTQTQQAMMAGYSHAVQLELSKALRSLLAADEGLLAAFANALRAAWVQAKHHRRSPVAPSAL
ncbi:unnamed protein product [Effrenium voratum]|nr:unnamed protein product [Effrenium voratum]